MEEIMEMAGWFSYLDSQLSAGGRGMVMKLNIENFKRMNDLFGSEYCDELLKTIMDYLDQQTGSRVFRNVGVEFIVVMQNRSVQDARELAEKLMERFQKSWSVGDKKCFCSIQIALCEYPGFASNANDMLKCLELAMLRGMEQGSNQIVLYDQELHGHCTRRQAIAENLGAALEKNEVEVCYRPVYDTEKQAYMRAELLMRVHIQGVGMVDSAEFLPIAEDIGQARQVEEYALKQAARGIDRLLKEGKQFESISVKVSPSLLQQGDFVDEISGLMDEYKFPPKKLALEIDEYAASTAYCDISVLLQNLSWLGVELILGNFGSGSTGLSWIFELPVDTLEFGRMFMWQLEHNPKTAPINEGLVQIAKRMNKKIMASCVETQQQKDMLDAFGCNMQQGAYYTPLISEEELGKLLK